MHKSAPETEDPAAVGPLQTPRTLLQILAMKFSAAFTVVSALFVASATARVARRQSGGCRCAS